nr:MAG: hypothetical protein [Bacteriophage sp.]
MIKIGDHLQPTEHARVNYNFDKLGIELPIVAVNVFTDSGGTMYVQFLSPPTRPSPEGDLILRTWNARNLVPYTPKPRCKRVPVDSMRVGDKVWSHEYRSWLTIVQVGFAASQKTEALWEGSRYVWKQTALQTNPGAQGGRGHIDTSTLSGQHPDDLSRLAGQSRLDEGAGSADAVPREGDGGTADPVQSPAQPRETVRMTLGRDIKPGQRISCEVAHDPARKVNYFHAGPFGEPVLIIPNLHYLVVNEVTK